MKTTTVVAVMALVVVASGAAFVTGRALATGAPGVTPLTYAGTVTDASGKAYGVVQDVTLRFYDKAEAGTAKCTAPTVQAEAGTGRFQVVLPGECVLAVHEVGDLWAEATVGAAKVVLPRTHVGAVPYALEADVAKAAGTALAAGGSLKLQMDGLAGEVGVLKASGGGGPWVVDAKGVKVGKLIDYLYQPNGSAQMTVVTSSGYLVVTMTDGYVQTKELYFEQAKCSGPVWLAMPGIASSNKRAWYFGGAKTFFVQDGDPAGVASGTNMSTSAIKSRGWAAGCIDEPLGNGTKEMLPVHAVINEKVGLPATLTHPLTIID